VAAVSLVIVAVAASIPASSSAAGPVVTAPLGQETSPRTAGPGARLVHKVVVGRSTWTLRMQRVDLRGPNFRVLVQGADGYLTAQEVAPERAYIGTVDGHPSATASAVVRSDGTISAQVVRDRGVDLRFRDTSLVYEGDQDPYDRGIKWPASTETSRNETITPGRARGTYAFEVGFDLDDSYFVGRLDSSVAEAVDEVELAMVDMAATYERDAMLRPVLGTVVLRAAHGASPYAEASTRTGFFEAHGGVLDAARTEWSTRFPEPDRDAVIVLQSFVGGGLASLEGLSTQNAFASAGVPSGMDQDYNVVRHELGHLWGAGDYHTDGPEDETIMSGNHFARFDGTEVKAFWDLRDERALSGAVTEQPAPSAPLPPYAALDLLDAQRSAVPVRLRPLANDHDANGSALSLHSVDARSHLGGKVTMSRGVVTYTPPSVTEPLTDDWFRYVVRDASGQRATGVVIARVSPSRPIGSPADWPTITPPTAFESSLVNVQSGQLAAGTTSSAVVQLVGNRASTRWAFRAVTGGWQIRNVHTGKCLSGTTTVTQVRCASDSDTPAAQRWTLRRHPLGGFAVMSSKNTCLSPTGRSIAFGARLLAETCAASPAHRWSVHPHVTDGEFRLLSAPSQQPLALPLDARGYEELGLREGTDAYTSWRITRATTGLFELKNLGNPGFCAYYPYGSAIGAIASWHCDGADTEQFGLVENPSGGISLVTQTGLCATATTARNRTGMRVDGRPCNGSRAQSWDLTRVEQGTRTARP
jgi:hypothetical protein